MTLSATGNYTASTTASGGASGGGVSVGGAVAIVFALLGFFLALAFFFWKGDGEVDRRCPIIRSVISQA